MAGNIEHAAGTKLRRRATIFMAGAALSALYVWMQPAALGTLEANSAQAADGSSTGCVINVGGKDVRVHSKELCSGVRLNLAPPAPMPAAEPPADLLRTPIEEEADVRPLPPRERFSRAVPRVKPEAPLELAAERADKPTVEEPPERDDIERDYTRLAEREDRPERPDDDRPDSRDDGPDTSDGGERDDPPVCD